MLKSRLTSGWDGASRQTAVKGCSVSRRRATWMWYSKGTVSESCFPSVMKSHRGRVIQMKGRFDIKRPVLENWISRGIITFISAGRFSLTPSSGANASPSIRLQWSSNVILIRSVRSIATASAERCGFIVPFCMILSESPPESSQGSDGTEVELENLLKRSHSDSKHPLLRTANLWNMEE